MPVLRGCQAKSKPKRFAGYDVDTFSDQLDFDLFALKWLGQQPRRHEQEDNCRQYCVELLAHCDSPNPVLSSMVEF